jgi:WD40 repeat protein
VFSPTRSLIRGLFKEEEPKGIIIKPAMQDKWSSYLQTLEGHGGTVYSVAFSHDSTWLASASDDRTVKIWDARSGECLRTLNTGRALFDILFDVTGSCLYTEIGAIIINASSVLEPTATTTEP